MVSGNLLSFNEVFLLGMSNYFLVKINYLFAKGGRKESSKTSNRARFAQSNCVVYLVLD